MNTNLTLFVTANMLVFQSLMGIANAENREINVAEYLMPVEKEVALARSAAPDFVSRDATVLVLTRNGYVEHVNGTNGFVCIVLRSWGEAFFRPDRAYNPETIDPECMNPAAAEAILPVQLLRAELGLKGTDPLVIKSTVQEKFRTGEIERIQGVGFSYMLSNRMTRHRPHIMFYIPDSEGAESFGNRPGESQLVYVIGGKDEPYIAAVTVHEERGIDPVGEVE